MTLPIRLVSTFALLTFVACGGPAGQSTRPQLTLSTHSGGTGGGGTGGGGTGGGGGTTTTAPPSTTPYAAPTGGTRIPPQQTVDGPAWFFYDANNVGAIVADIDFNNLQNLSTSAVPVGDSRTAQEIVFNVSKKTALTITSITIAGANASDFYIPAAEIAAAATTTVAVKGQEMFDVYFAPTGSGLRTAQIFFTSNAGVAYVNVKGTAVAPQPALGSVAPCNFYPDSAPANMTISNSGGAPLILSSISIGGANPDAFQFFVANSGQSNCYSGIELPPGGFCELAVGTAPGALAPENAALVLISNDPASPESDVGLALLPPPTL